LSLASAHNGCERERRALRAARIPIRARAVAAPGHGRRAPERAAGMACGLHSHASRAGRSGVLIGSSWGKWCQDCHDKMRQMNDQTWIRRVAARAECAKARRALDEHKARHGC
jgi:hypothetical protein